MKTEFGKFILIIGVILVLAGIVLMSNISIPWLGRLPGDIHIKRDNFSFYFPLTTCILISLLLTLISYFFRK
jgi:hypothetical protein